MKLLIAALIALPSFAFANTCQSVDQVISDAREGMMKVEPYNFSLGSAIAAANLCQLEQIEKDAKWIKGLCNTKVGLLKDLLVAAKAAFEYGLTTQIVVTELEQKLSAAEASCPQ